MFGCWFGRPMDNLHECVGAELELNILRLRFNEGEELEIVDPSELVIDGQVLRIPMATRVRWSWFLYGRAKEPNNLMYYEYRAINGAVESDTNSPWPTSPCASDAAVELF
jgi:hypothetical protein